MKTIDPVMQEVWKAKDANAKTYKNLSTYLAYLQKQSRRKHVGGRVPVPAPHLIAGSMPSHSS